jgi:hypothetical protein
LAYQRTNVQPPATHDWEYDHFNDDQQKHFDCDAYKSRTRVKPVQIEPFGESMDCQGIQTNGYVANEQLDGELKVWHFFDPGKTQNCGANERRPVD